MNDENKLNSSGSVTCSAYRDDSCVTIERKKGVNVYKLFRYLLKKWYIIIAAVLVCSACAFLLTEILVVPLYDSEAKLYLLANSSDADEEMTSAELTLTEKLITNSSLLIREEMILGKVIENLDLDIGYEKLRERVRVVNPLNSHYLYITVSDESADNAKRIADEICVVSAEYVETLIGIDRVSVISQGKVPAYPSNDHSVRNTVFGGAFGFVLICAVLSLVFCFCDKINTPEEIEKNTQMTVLASIPYVRKN